MPDQDPPLPVTSVVKNIAREYRDRATQARKRAADATSDEARASLKQIAESWDRMASYEERTNPRRHLWNQTPQDGSGDGTL